MSSEFLKDFRFPISDAMKTLNDATSLKSLMASLDAIKIVNSSVFGSIAAQRAFELEEVRSAVRSFKILDLSVFDNFDAISKAAAIEKMTQLSIPNIYRLSESILPDYSRVVAGAFKSEAMESIINVGQLTSVARSSLDLNDSVLNLIKSISFYEAIAKHTHIGLPKAYMETMKSLDVVLKSVAWAGHDRFKYNDLFMRGFQAVGALSLDGILPTGLSSDVLLHYSDTISTAPLFSDAVAVANFMDIDEVNENAFVQFLDKVKHLLFSVLANERDIIKRAGITGVVMFILTLLSLWISIQQSQRPGTDAEEFSEQTTEIHSLGQILYAQKAASEDREKNIRFVHIRSPLRTEPNASAPLLRYVYPDQYVRILTVKEGWAKVQVLDYQSDNPMDGWIYRGNLRIAPAS